MAKPVLITKKRVKLKENTNFELLFQHKDNFELLFQHNHER